MTPKEKAEDLLYQMRCDHMDGILTKKKARRCAKIAVDEIYFAIYDYLKDTYELQNADREFAYWEEVKQELDKL